MSELLENLNKVRDKQVHINLIDRCINGVQKLEDKLKEAHKEIDRLIERLDDLTGPHIELHKDYNDKNNECDRLKDEIENKS